jgi:hypothetical protein
MELNYSCLDYLKKSELPWIKYKISKKLNPNDCEQITNLKKILLSDGRITKILDEAKKWPEPPLSRHSDVKHIIHKICLLLDFGLDNQDNEIKEISEKILANQDDKGAFLSTILIPKAYGGADEPALQWLMCDFPILLYILIYLGLKENKQVVKAIEFLKSIVDDNGWRCQGSVEKFRGPGRKADHCPNGTLISLKVFSMLPEFHSEEFIKNGIDAILNQWVNRKERKIYMFAMGTDFKKLKYPNHWFDIVHVCRVLSRFEYAKKAEPFLEMLQIIKDKQLSNGGFVPESAYTEYKGWDFGQKKEASPSLTYAIWDTFENL